MGKNIALDFFNRTSSDIVCKYAFLNISNGKIMGNMDFSYYFELFSFAFITPEKYALHVVGYNEENEIVFLSEDIKFVQNNENRILAFYQDRKDSFFLRKNLLFNYRMNKPSGVDCYTYLGIKKLQLYFFDRKNNYYSSMLGIDNLLEVKPLGFEKQNFKIINISPVCLSVVNENYYNVSFELTINVDFSNCNLTPRQGVICEVKTNERETTKVTKWYTQLGKVHLFLVLRKNDEITYVGKVTSAITEFLDNLEINKKVNKYYQLNSIDSFNDLYRGFDNVTLYSHNVLESNEAYILISSKSGNKFVNDLVLVNKQIMKENKDGFRV